MLAYLEGSDQIVAVNKIKVERTPRDGEWNLNIYADADAGKVTLDCGTLEEMRKKLESISCSSDAILRLKREERVLL